MSNHKGRCPDWCPNCLPTHTFPLLALSSNRSCTSRRLWRNWRNGRGPLLHSRRQPGKYFWPTPIGCGFLQQDFSTKNQLRRHCCLHKRMQEYGGSNTNGPAKHLLYNFRRQIAGLMDLLIKDADILRNTITSLKSSLLQVDNENRNKQSVGLIVGSTILSRVLGTLMGWFTHRCLNNLRNQISEVKNEQHRLLQIQQMTMTRLDALEKFLREVAINGKIRKHLGKLFCIRPC